MAESTKVTPYLNLPIQSGDDEILEAMKRPYNVAKYKKLVGRLRKSFLVHRNGLEANLAVSTDVIVGFPGETKKQFTNTATVFRAIKYDMAYIACYSQRNGTDSSKLADNVDLLEKKRREEEINEIIKTTALAHNKKYLGKTVDVLVDELRKSFALGKTRSYKTVKLGIAGNKVNPGDFVRVKITGAKPFGLAGTIIENGK